jgi:hypothetical protein
MGVAVRTRREEKAARSGFVHELFSLQDAEAMLFVDGDESEALKATLFDQGVGADYKLRRFRDVPERSFFRRVSFR